MMSLLIKVDAVHNHYVLMNDAPSQPQFPQQEFEFEEQPECEQPDDRGDYVEQRVYQEQLEFFQEETEQRQMMGEAESMNTFNSRDRST